MPHGDSLQIADSAALDEACGNAMKLQLGGKAGLAEQLYRAILQAAPNHATANHCLGMLNVQLHRPTDGLPYLRAALNANPELPDYWLGYLEALLQAGEIDEATETLGLARRHGLAGAAVDNFAERLDARLPQPAAVKPAAAQDQPAKLSRADRRREARRARPNDAALLAMIEQRRYAEARVQAGLMTERFPDHGLGWKILGAMLWAEGKTAEALDAMQTSARLMPADAEIHSNLGITLAKLKRFEEADSFLRKALDINPNFAAAHYRQGMSYELQGRYGEAEASLRKAIALRSDSLTVDDEHGYSNLLYLRSYNPEVDAATLFAEHRRFGEDFEAALRASWPRHPNAPDPDRCLKVGLVSGDLRQHAVATFLEPALMRLNLCRSLELHAYSNSAVEDEVSARLRQHVKHWHAIAPLSDPELCEKIMGDRIDILIDLSGHTGLNRLRAFARKPAPIQVSWIGYPGTTGLSAMDYYLTDCNWLPQGQFDASFTEKLVYLSAAAIFRPSQSAPPVNGPPSLTSGCFTFGSFNRLGKINAATVDLWSRLLRALPTAKLLLGGVSLDGKQLELIAQFAAQGIARERLTFHPRCGMDTYLGLHHQVDMCLDTTPYSGGTTTHHAAWMGVPTLTLAGGTPAARQGAGIMLNLGLEAFVAANAADFVAKGDYWTSHPASLAEVRAGLRERSRGSPYQQTEVLVAGLERALRRMWVLWCAKLPASSFAVE
jgi:predicted O-linked N-acetylglucosamine transferase (SPINDLY family)